MTYTLKSRPEDFIVEELIDLDLVEGEEFTYFLLTKKNRNTLDAVLAVARALGCPQNKVGYAGNKDKRALTSQYCSVPSTFAARLTGIQIQDVSLQVIGEGKTSIYIGRNQGNRFRIIVRNLDRGPQQKTSYLNLFGPQRFGTQNVAVGRALVKKEFARAQELIFKNPIEKGMNPVNALRKIHKRTLKLFVHAYQSFLWNEWVTQLSAERKLPKELELPGFNVQEDGILQAIFHREGITSRDFIIPQFPEISGEPLPRSTLLVPEHLKIGSLSDDDLNQGKKACLIEFSLPKGSYATVIIDQLFGQPM